MSMMSGKSFAAGELGMLVTDDELMYERAMAYGHYERNNPAYVKDPSLTPYPSIALGGVKGRANQLCSTLALGQLKYFDERSAEINRAMNYFCDGIEGLRGLHPIRPDKGGGSTMGAWYSAQAAYFPEELEGLSSHRFAEAIRSETGYNCWEGGNFPLHTHRFFKDFDFYNLGKPSRIAFAERDVRELDAAVEPSSASIASPSRGSKSCCRGTIDKYIEATARSPKTTSSFWTRTEQKRRQMLRLVKPMRAAAPADLGSL